MSDVLTEYLERFIDLDDRVFRLVFDRDDTKDEIIRLVTIEQLFEKGIDGSGELIQPEGYSPRTIEIKKQKGQRTDVFTLNDEGDFYASFVVTVSKDAFVIDAQDNKGDVRLFEVYGEDIAGLTDQSFDDLFIFVRDVVFELLEEIK